MGSVKTLKQRLNELLGLDYTDDDVDEEISEIESDAVCPVNHEVKPKGRSVKPAIVDFSAAISVFSPSSYDDCRLIADRLKAREIVIVNYDMMPPSEARKVLFFIHGCVYALDGTSQKVSASVFMYAPKTVGVQAPKQKERSLEDTLRMPWEGPLK